jgi:tetratricopeptide (TPR) repeat protein
MLTTRIVFGYELMADYYIQAGDYDSADIAYTKGLAILKKNDEETEKWQTDSDEQMSMKLFIKGNVCCRRVVVYYKLGNLKYKTGEMMRARDCYEESLKEGLKLLHNAEYDGMLELSYSDLKIGILDTYMRVAQVLIQENDDVNAFAYAKKTLSLAEELVAENSDFISRSYLAGSYHLLGDTYWNSGDISEAAESYKAAISIFSELVKEDRSLNERLMLLYSSVSDAYNRLGDHESERVYAEKHLELLQNSHKNSD